MRSAMSTWPTTWMSIRSDLIAAPRLPGASCLCAFWKTQGNLFARSQDWTEGIQDRTDLEAAYGAFLKIDTSYLNEYLNEIGFRLGHVMRTTHKILKYSGDEEQSIEDCRLIGVCRIIM